MKSPKAPGVVESKMERVELVYGRALAEVLHANGGWGWGVRVARGGIIWRGRVQADALATGLRRGDERSCPEWRRMRLSEGLSGLMLMEEAVEWEWQWRDLV